MRRKRRSSRNNSQGTSIRALDSRAKWGRSASERSCSTSSSRSMHPHQTRAAVEAVTFHPHADFVAPLVELLKKCPPDDTHLRYAARVALRNCLRDNERVAPTGGPWTRSTATLPSLSRDVRAAAFLMDADRAAIEIADAKLARRRPNTSRGTVRGSNRRLARSNGLTNPRANGMHADAILASFRGVQARGGRAHELSQVDLIMAATHREIDSLREINDRRKRPKSSVCRRHCGCSPRSQA